MKQYSLLLCVRNSDIFQSILSYSEIWVMTPWINFIAHQRANQHLDNSVSLWPQNDWSLDPVQQGSKQVCTADQV